MTNFEIYYGHLDGELFGVDSYFDNAYEPEWIENDIATGILKDICNMVERQGQAITVNWFNEGRYVTIGPRDLPGGVKALLIMLNTDEVVQACRCGNNCAKWIVEIAKVKPLKIALASFMEFNVDFDAHVLNDDSYIHSYADHIVKSLDLLFYDEDDEDDEDK